MDRFPAIVPLIGRDATTAYVLIFGLLGISGTDALGQQYPFLPVAGSPTSVTTLFQDSRGRLWVGGRESALFDGARFFPLRDYGYPPGESYVFAEDSSGVMWISSETGVYRFAGGRLERVSQGFAVELFVIRPDLAIAAMGPLGKGVPAKRTLCRIQRVGKGWKTQAVMTLDSPGCVGLEDGKTIAYPGPGKGWSELRLADVLRWQAGDPAPTPIRHPAPLVAGNPDIWIALDPFGCLWMGGNGTISYDCGKESGDVPLGPANIHSAMTPRWGNDLVLWGNTQLVVGHPGSFHSASRENGLPGVAVAIPSRDGTIWIGTTQGLYRWASPFRLEYWTIRDGVAGPPFSVTRSGGRIYSGLGGGRVIALNEDLSKWDDVASIAGSKGVVGMMGTEDGTLLATRERGSVLIGAAGKVLAQTARDHPKAAMRVAPAADGEIWSGGEGLGRLTRRGSVLNWQEHPLGTNPSKSVLAIKYEKRTRKLWSCYSGGLVERDEHGNWKEFNTRDGLIENPCWSLAPMPNGDVWYAYYTVPAISLVRSRADGTIAVRHYGRDSGALEPGAFTLDADPRGWLWRGFQLGLYVADGSEAEAGKWLKLDQSDGFPATGTNSGSVFVDKDDSLWFGADNDLVHYTPPPDLVTPKFAPQVFVSAFSWEGQATRLAEAVGEIPHGANVVAHIGSLQFDRRNALQLRYRVLPEQSAWRESSTLDLALGALSAGAHTLEVQGRVFTGPWSTTQSRALMVLRPIWLAWPLLALYAITGTTLAGGGFLLHRRRRAERAELLPDLAAWRLGALLPEVNELTGTVLDARFEVGELLARGGFANVMQGYDREQKKRCAVKVFRGEIRDKDWIQRRFEQEVAALKRVRHPNVVTIYAHGSAPSGGPYLVMEFVEGKNLREVLEGGLLPARRTAGFLRQLAGALDAIHAEGIWHRDVKPENIIIRNEGMPAEDAVLIDFSIAIVKDANETLHGLSRAAGSFDYMAPEQAIGYAEASSDIYSLAKLAIEMLTGRRLSSLLPDAYLDLPDRVRELLEALDFRLSPETIDVVSRALEFDPTKRPRTASSLAGPLADDLDC